MMLLTIWSHDKQQQQWISTTKVSSSVLLSKLILSMRTIAVLFLLCLLRSFQWCIAIDLLKAGQNITGTLVLDSADGHRFTLGFFSSAASPPKSYYLGIWYNREQYPGRQTVVWVANRDKPVAGSNGVFQIDEDGNLVVKDTSGETYWSSKSDGSKTEGSLSTNRRVKLLDSGNLVLFQDDHNGTSYIWQSFQHPTDTFLPGMQMETDLELISWRDESDPHSGNFIFKMAQTGNNRRYHIFNSQHQLQWENGGLNSDALTPDTLNYLANFTNIPKNFSGSPFNRTSKYVNQSNDTRNRWQSLYSEYRDTRIVVNPIGEIQFLKWEEPGWNMQWKHPLDKCHIHNSCGNFSSCNPNDWRPCKCLPGFVENQNTEGGSRFAGCSRKSERYDNKDMMFLNLTMVRVGTPDLQIRAEYEPGCQSVCLEELRGRCQAYSYNASTSVYDRSLFICGIWTRDLTTLQVVPDGGGDLSVLVKRSDIAPIPKSCEPCGIYTIPYPLSTGPNCGDPMYNKFNCSSLTGDVSFMMPRGESYRVTGIDEKAGKFYIHTDDSYSYHCDDNYQINKPDFPFNVTNCGFKDDEIEVSWLPAREPPCNEPTDCKNWPHSTCSATSEGGKRCYCDSKYQSNNSNLSCTQAEQSRNLPLILTITLTGIIFLACTIIFAYYVWRNKIAPKLDRENIQIQESLYCTERHVKGLIGLGRLEEKDSQGIEVPFYSFGSILAATDNFSESNKLGRGGYGPVYKGRFPGGQDIAVKRLSSVSTQGLEEFKNEVILIAKLQHRNLVRLRGYCIKGDEKILLYEYMPNKSLDSFIFDRTRTLLLDWQMQFNIILGIARELLYLHQDSRLKIIHRDLKTSNILLDEEMTPKISDFGLAKIVEGKETEASTQKIVGTYGYMAPEYALDGFFSIKSDIFSFGVVLLEILSGKKNTGFYQSKQTATLLGYAWGLWTENRLLDLMDASLRGTCNESQFIKCALIGLLCVQDEPGDRPTMSNILTMLDSEIATIPTPTQPTFYAIKRLSSTASSSSSRKPETTLQIDSSYQEGR